MAKPRKEWNLEGQNFITVKDEKIEIKKPKPADTTVKVIDTVTDVDALLNHINTVEKNETPMTVADVLREYVNENIRANTRISLRNVADPQATVNKAIETLRKKFPHVSDEQLKAMAEMLSASMAE